MKITLINLITFFGFLIFSFNQTLSINTFNQHIQTNTMPSFLSEEFKVSAGENAYVFHMECCASQEMSKDYFRSGKGRVAFYIPLDNPNNLTLFEDVFISHGPIDCPYATQYCPTTLYHQLKELKGRLYYVTYNEHRGDVRYRVISKDNHVFTFGDGGYLGQIVLRKDNNEEEVIGEVDVAEHVVRGNRNDIYVKATLNI